MAVDKHVGIVSEIFPLWPYCKSGNADWLFSVTLNAGLVAPNEADLKTLLGLLDPAFGTPQDKLQAVLPWHWNIDRVRVWVFKPNTAQPVEIANISLVKARPDRFKPNQTQFDDEYINALETYLSNASDTWKQLGTFALDIAGLGVERDGKGTLQNLLATVATWPLPYAHFKEHGSSDGTNLALTIKLSKADLDTAMGGAFDEKYWIAAVPEFTYRGTGLTAALPSAAPADGNSPIPAEYTPLIGAEWVSYAGAAPLKRPDADLVKYNPDTYFIGDIGQSLPGYLDNDPVADLFDRAAERFDLPLILLNRLREIDGTADALPQSQFDTVLRVILCSLRDSGGAGLALPIPDPSDAACAFDRILEALKSEFSVSDWKKLEPGANELRSKLEEWQSSELKPEKWLLLLADIVPELKTILDAEGNLLAEPAQDEKARPGTPSLKQKLDVVAKTYTTVREVEGAQRLLHAQWLAAAEGSPLAAPFLQDGGVSERLTKSVLQQTGTAAELRGDNLRRFWHDILPARDKSNADFAKEFRAGFVDQLVRYADNRCLSSFLNSRDQPNCESLFSIPLGLDIAAVAVDLASELLAAATALGYQLDSYEFGSAAPGGRPHKITVQVAPVHRADSPRADQQHNNITTEIAGYGALLRRSKANSNQSWAPWRILSLAAARIEAEYSQGGNQAAPILSADDKLLETVMPVALGYGRSRDGFLSYDENSLSARQLLGVGLDTARSGDEPVLDFVLGDANIHQLKYPSNDNWRTLPALAYGAFYEFAPFVIGQAGILPPQIAESPAYPSALLEHSSMVDTKVPTGARRKMRYVRKVPVGPLRLTDQKPDSKFWRAASRSRDILPIATALPAPGESVRTSKPLFYDETLKAGQLAISAAGSITIRFGGIKVKSTDGDVCKIAITWGGGNNDRVTIDLKRNGTSIDGSLTFDSHTGPFVLDNILLAGKECWISLGVTLDISDIWRFQFAGGRLGESHRSASQAVDIPPPQMTPAAWIDVSGTDEILHPSVLVDGFLAPGSPVNDVPLLLMTDKTDLFELDSELTFGILPPVTDADTFARWRRMDKFLEELNPSVPPVDWTDIIDDVAIATELLAEKESIVSAQVEDPAVTNIIAMLIPMRGAPDVRSQVWQARTKNEFGRPTTSPKVPADGMTAEQLAALIAEATHTPDKVSVSCAVTGAIADADNRLEWDDASSTFKVSLKPGEIWELRLYPATPTSRFEAQNNGNDDCRFHPGLGAPRQTFQGFTLFSPLRFTLESVTDHLPDTEQIWSAIDPSLVADTVTVNYRRELEFDPAQQLAATLAWDNVGEAQLNYQAFVWSGRPLDPYPFGQSHDPDRFPDDTLEGKHELLRQTAPSNIILWEAAGMENVEGSTSLSRQRSLGPDGDGAILLQTDLRSHPRGSGAQHYRFSLRTSHRYIALSTPAGRAKLVGRSMKGTLNKMATAWRRLTVPARPQGPLPPPSLKFQVPLMSALEPNSNPMLLAHFDEPWAQTGGLAEILEAQIASTLEVADSGNFVPPARHIARDTVWSEIGPDPILIADADGVAREFVPLQTENVIGHTFDTGTAAPGIHAASVMITSSDTREFDWHMLKVKFRRILHPLGVAGGATVPQAISTKATPGETPITLNSDIFFAWDSFTELSGTNTVSLLTKSDEKIGSIKIAIKKSRNGKIKSIDFVEDAANSPQIRVAAKTTVSLEHYLEADKKAVRLYMCARRAGQPQDSGGNPNEKWEIGFYTDKGHGAWLPLGCGTVEFPATAGGIELKLNYPSTLEKNMHKGQFHASEWTAGNWSQFLGRQRIFNNTADDELDIEKFSLKIVPPAKKGGEFDLQIIHNTGKASGRAIELPPRPNGGPEDFGTNKYPGFYYRVLVTQTVFDVNGTRNSEAPVGLYEADSASPDLLKRIDKRQSASGIDVSMDPANLRARIMLWQERPKHSDDSAPDDEDWSLVFPKPVNGNDRASSEPRARIVQILPPIEKESSRKDG